MVTKVKYISDGVVNASQITLTTASIGDNTTAPATTAFVQQEMAALVDSSPSTLDTLNELAAALGDDPNFATTTATAIGLKAPIASPTFTGTVTAAAIHVPGGGNIATNEAFGTGSLVNNTTGYVNTAVGYQALYSNTEGYYNTAVGHSSLYTNTTGSYNTAYGIESLYLNTTGGFNTAIGWAALKENDTGDYNTALSYNALGTNTTGASNTAIGMNALALITTTSNNIAVGYNSGNALTGSNNTIIGSIAGEAGVSDTVIIGAGTTERLRIDSSGYFGIGTDAPTHGLTVSDDTGGDDANFRRITIKSAIHGVNSGFRFDSESANGTARGGGYYFQPGDTDATTYLGLSASDAAYQMVVTRDGNVGIGTSSPNKTLEVANAAGGATISISTDQIPGSISAKKYMSLDFTGYNNNQMAQIQSWDESSSTGYGYLTFSTRQNNASLVEAVRIDASGNVGIGNDDANLPLTVTSNSGANAIAIRARTGDDYGFLQFYNNAGDTVRGQLYSHSTGNAVGISTGSSSSNGIKIDGDGLHFQKVDGQKISAKESIVMQIDSDNNTASRVFQVTHGNGNILLNLHDDYSTDVGTLQYSSTRSAGAGATGSFSASAGDWVDVAAIPYGRNVATIKFFWDGLSAPGSSHHGLMEFDIASHYGTSYYYGWDSSINLKNSTAHNSFYISEARIITPGGAGATGYFQVKFPVAVSTGTFRSYVTARDESCSIDPVNPVVNNSRSGTTLAHLKLGTDQGLVRNRVSMATSRDMHIGGGLTIVGQTSFNAYSPAVTSTNSTVVFGNAKHNVGGGYSTSTGKFTASTAGKYFFTFDILMNSTATANYGRVLFRVNDTGSNMEQYGDSLTYQASGQSYFGLGLTCLISLNVGDTVEVYNAGQWPTYGTAYGVFCGHLLG